MEKSKKENFNLNINPENLKKHQCPKCLGTGKFNKGKTKCPMCGGSGSLKNINIMPDFVNIEMGKPQIKYEVTVKDTENNKILYKKAGYGGIMASVEDIINFSGKEIEGNFQSALWGNPLIQRFAIDRLEEIFAKNIDQYVQAMEQSGVWLSNKEQMKKILIEGNTLKLLETMRGEERTDKINFSETKENTDENIKKFINKIQNTIEGSNPFSIFMVSQPFNNNTIATIEAIIKNISFKKLIISVLEFTSSAVLKKENRPNDDLEKKKIMLKILQDITNDLLNTIKK